MKIGPAVFVMTHAKGVTNEDYWDSIKAYEPARLVKLCDIYDNLDPERMCYLDPGTQTRLRRKYANALLALA